MPLTLVPALTDQTRAEIEDHLTVVRARRMVAAITYHEGKNAKLEHESATLQRRVTQQYDLLAKKIERLDKALEAVDKTMANIDALLTEQNLVRNMITVLDKEDNTDD